MQRVGYQTSAYTVSGTFTLTHNGQTTSALSATATAAQVQSALEALSGIGTGNVTVELLAKPSGTNDRTFKIGKEKGSGLVFVIFGFRMVDQSLDLRVPTKNLGYTVP